MQRLKRIDILTNRQESTPEPRSRVGFRLNAIGAPWRGLVWLGVAWRGLQHRFVGSPPWSPKPHAIVAGIGRRA